MTRAEERQMNNRKRALLKRMQTRYAPIRRMRIPTWVASAPWFKESGLVKILEVYALLAFMFEGFSGKIAAAFKILLEEEEAGHLASKPIIVAATSGNFGFAMAMLLVSLRKAFDVGGFIATVEINYFSGEARSSSSVRSYCDDRSKGYDCHRIR